MRTRELTCIGTCGQRKTPTVLNTDIDRRADADMHKHTHKYTHTHTHTRTHTHINNHTATHTHTHVDRLTERERYMHTRLSSLPLPLFLFLALSRSLSHTHTHKHTPLLSHTLPLQPPRTHTLALFSATFSPSPDAVTTSYAQPLNLRPAYDPLPDFTTLTDDFRGMLDHIFLTPRVCALAHLDMFSEETILEVCLCQCIHEYVPKINIVHALLSTVLHDATRVCSCVS